MLGSSLHTAGEPLVRSSGEQLPSCSGDGDRCMGLRCGQQSLGEKKACMMQMNKEIFLFTKLLQNVQLLLFAFIKNEVPLHRQ